MDEGFCFTCQLQLLFHELFVIGVHFHSGSCLTCMGFVLFNFPPALPKRGDMKITNLKNALFLIIQICELN